MLFVVIMNEAYYYRMGGVLCCMLQKEDTQK